ncbi:MAG: hypothetical protein VX672_02585, partial [Planctomycetota bacterium]|nr:hypothetical protein [Planctomycetota bacterium]
MPDRSNAPFRPLPRAVALVVALAVAPAILVLLGACQGGGQRASESGGGSAEESRTAADAAPVAVADLEELTLPIEG